MKWGEYSSDVQFILQRSDQPKVTTNPSNSDQATKNPASSPPQATESPKKAKSTFDTPKMPYKSPEMQTKSHNLSSDSFKLNESRKSDIIGIVKGMTRISSNQNTAIH